MRFPPHYVFTPRISEFLQKIEASKQVLESVSIPEEIEVNIRRNSTLRSSLYSARIEGNTLSLDDLTHKISSDQRKQEIFNILKALNMVIERGNRDLTVSVLLQLHERVLEGLALKDERGKFRKEASAIFNSAGIAVYMPPPPRQISGLIEKLVSFVNLGKEQFWPIRAVLAHYIFEKIHPFLDGNGRVGRLLLHLVLQKGGYAMKQLTSIEEYLDNHRSEYYRCLELGEDDVTDFVEFMLEGIALTSENAREEVLLKQKAIPEDYLLPRRAEILNIIKDQRLVNFDQIRRRFQAVNERTLRFDLKKLADGGFIRKLGMTKGVYYEAIEKANLHK